MAVIDWPVDWRRATRNTRTIIAYVRRGTLIAQSWPSPRGRARTTPAQWEQVEWLAQAARLVKYAPPLDRFFRRIYTVGTMRMDRDLAISAMAGRLFPTIVIDGVRYYSVAILKDISTNLDLFASQPGSMLTRGALIWTGIPVGNPGDILTLVGTTPTWQSLSLPPEPDTLNPQPYAISSGLTTYLTEKLVASHFKVHETYTVRRIAWREYGLLSTYPRHPFLLQTTQPLATSTIEAVLSTCPTLPNVLDRPYNYTVRLPSAVTLVPGAYYAVAVSIEHPTNPNNTWINNNSLANIHTWWPVETIDKRYGLDKVTPEIGDTLTQRASNIIQSWVW